MLSLGFENCCIQYNRDLSISFLRATCRLLDAYAPLQLLVKHQGFLSFS